MICACALGSRVDGRALGGLAVTAWALLGPVLPVV